MNVVKEKLKSCTDGSDHTDRVAGLLDEKLSQLDHRIIVVEPFGEEYHLVGRILLIAWASKRLKAEDPRLRALATLQFTPCGDLSPTGSVEYQHRISGAHTQACNHLSVESVLT